MNHYIENFIFKDTLKIQQSCIIEILLSGIGGGDIGGIFRYFAVSLAGLMFAFRYLPTFMREQKQRLFGKALRLNRDHMPYRFPLRNIS